MFRKQPVQFSFAGFDFPRYIPEINRMSGAAKERFPGKKLYVECTYFHAPKPGADGMTFYLDSNGMPGLRWDWCDDVARIDHTGWFTDSDGVGDQMRGIVFRLPHGRGFLAGWSMGEGMVTSMEYNVIEDQTEAAHRADDMARIAAEKELDYRANENDDDGDCVNDMHDAFDA